MNLPVLAKKDDVGDIYLAVPGTKCEVNQGCGRCRVRLLVVHATRLLKCTHSFLSAVYVKTQTRETHDVVTRVCTRQPRSKCLKAELSVSRTLVWCTAVVAREIGTLLQSCRHYLDLMQVRLHQKRSEEKKRWLMEMYFPALGKQEEKQSERRGAAWGCTSLSNTIPTETKNHVRHLDTSHNVHTSPILENSVANHRTVLKDLTQVDTDRYIPRQTFAKRLTCTTYPACATYDSPNHAHALDHL